MRFRPPIWRQPWGAEFIRWRNGSPPGTLIAYLGVPEAPLAHEALVGPAESMAILAEDYCRAYALDLVYNC